jgi:hypothetical protein
MMSYVLLHLWRYGWYVFVGVCSMGLSESQIRTQQLREKSLLPSCCHVWSWERRLLILDCSSVWNMGSSFLTRDKNTPWNGTTRKRNSKGLPGGQAMTTCLLALWGGDSWECDAERQGNQLWQLHPGLRSRYTKASTPTPRLLKLLALTSTRRFLELRLRLLHKSSLCINNGKPTRPSSPPRESSGYFFDL